jgi:hypothetical protein
MRTILILFAGGALFLGGMYFQAKYPQGFSFPVTTSPHPATTTAPTTTKPEPKPKPGTPLSARVTIVSPKEGATVGKTFTITGKAPGNWYFEASFPIIVSDKDGSKIATSHGQAQSDWMTTDLVPFTAKIDVGSYSGPVTVNLLRDNPSGLPENDDSTSFDVVVQ